MINYSSHHKYLFKTTVVTGIYYFSSNHSVHTISGVCHMAVHIKWNIDISTDWNLPVPLSWNLGTLTSWNPLCHSRPVTGLIYLYLYLLMICWFNFCLQFRNLISWLILYLVAYVVVLFALCVVCKWPWRGYIWAFIV